MPRAGSGGASSRCGGTRFGTQPVTAADLYELALQCSIPLARGDEHAKRTSLGQALRRMRDRIYTVGGRRLRVHHAGVGAWRAALAAGGLRGQIAGRGSPASSVGLVGLIRRSESTVSGEASAEAHRRPTRKKPCKINAPVRPGGPGGPLSPLRVRAHARAIEEPGKGPPTPPGPPSPGNPRVSGGGPRGGLQNGGPPGSNGGWEELI